MQRKVSSKSGKANQELPLNGFARLDDDYAGIGPPHINLDCHKASAYLSTVCRLPANTSFTAQFPKSQMTLDVDLTIAPDDRPSIGEAAPAVGAPAEEAQKPGPMPACAGLVS